MDEAKPIVLYVRAGHYDIKFINTLRDNLTKRGITVTIIETDEIPESKPMVFKIPDVKIQDIIPAELKLVKTKTKYNTKQKNYRLYNKVRDNRLQVKLKTYQRTK